MTGLRCLPLLAGVAGCLPTWWEVDPIEGRTAWPPDAPLTLIAPVRLDDVGPLRDGLTLRPDRGEPIPLQLSWDRAAPQRLMLTPERPLAPDTDYELSIQAHGPPHGHDAQPAVRRLPPDCSVRFSTARRPTPLHTDRVCGTPDDPAEVGRIAWSEPVPTEHARVPDTLQISPDPLDPLLWHLEAPGPLPDPIVVDIPDFGAVDVAMPCRSTPPLFGASPRPGACGP